VENRAAVGYDWCGRHDYVLSEAKTWRANPKVVFIGDEILHIWAGRDSIGELDDSLTLPRWKAAFGGYGFSTLKLAFGGDRMQNVLWRLEHGVLDDIEPALVVLMVGRNNLEPAEGLSALSPEETAEAVRRIVAKLRSLKPSARVVLMGVLPAGRPDSASRAAAVRLNGLLLRIPGYEENVEYLDVSAKFLGKGGEIPRALMADLVHPTDVGYAILAQALKPWLSDAVGR